MQNAQQSMSSTPDTPLPRALDWLLLTILILVGGTSFAMIRGAIETIPPAIVAVARLWIGAIMMLIIMHLAGRTLPTLFLRHDRGAAISPAWLAMIACGIIGNSVPFLLFPWAQQYVPTGLAGIYMAIMPLWTIVLAALFASEALTVPRVAGFALGFLGVVVLLIPSLMAPDATGIATATNGEALRAQLGLIVATLGYAGSAVIARRAPAIRPRAFSAGILLSAALAATPALFFTPINPEDWSLISILCVIGLGIFATGMGAIIIIVIIQRNDAGFMSYANYLTPIWAVLLGVLLFRERLHPLVFVALAIITLGLYVSQRRRIS
ncbi:MAG: DMT family transporter [Pseudomonadota bacterium]